MSNSPTITGSYTIKFEDNGDDTVQVTLMDSSDHEVTSKSMPWEHVTELFIDITSDASHSNTMTASN